MQTIYFLYLTLPPPLYLYVCVSVYYVFVQILYVHTVCLHVCLCSIWCVCVYVAGTHADP